jgi:hypothetical protein
MKSVVIRRRKNRGEAIWLNRVFGFLCWNLKTERRRVFEFVDGVMCDDVSENESVLFVVYKGKKEE